jgi:glycosyltransferase involved in cell wall biosynthesis
MTIHTTPGRQLRIWLLQDGEPLPIDERPRLMRTGKLAERLVAAGHSVTWWTSRFNHAQKVDRECDGEICPLAAGYSLVLLGGPGYRRNISLARMQHHRRIAAHFEKLAAPLPVPDLILGSLPSPELCAAGAKFARAHGKPFIVDIRDPWPDIFVDYFPKGTQWLLAPLLQHYRRVLRSITSSAAGIVAVSDSMLRWALSYSGRAFDPERDRVIYIGYDQPTQPKIVRVPAQFTIEHPLNCVFVSTCGRSYDGSTVVKAARILEARGERRFRIVATGDGEMRAAWMAEAAGLKNMTFTGWIGNDELQRYVHEAHVGLIIMQGGITPFWLGNKIGEYLSSSLTLVNNVHGEVSRLVETEKLGLSVPAQNPGALADALSRLLESPSQVRSYMESSQRIFFQRFERDKIYEQYVRYLIDKAIAPSATPWQKEGVS